MHHSLPYRSLLLKLSLCLMAVLISGFVLLSPAEAQTPQEISSGVATMLPISGQDITAGDIISFSSGGYKKSSVAYDTTIFGVVVENPQIVLEDPSSDNSYPVISVGKVYVKVSAQNGPIKAGDLVTTSKIPGVGQRADASGYVLGTALESYESNNPDQTGKILVILNISFNSRDTTVSSNLIQSLKLALTAPEVSPVNALRYFLAAVIVLISFIFGIGFFGRVSATGVEAIGRNPLAGKLIMLSMLFHLSLALVIILIGIAIAYLILVL